MPDADNTPPSRSVPPPSLLQRALIDATRSHPVIRKRLVGPDINFGREHIGALAGLTDGWVGWEASTLRTIALELSFVSLSESGVRAGSDIEIGALINRALDTVIARGRAGEGFAPLASSLGFRKSLRDTILELRTGGVSGDALRAVVRDGSPAQHVPAVLEEFERLLAAQRLADPAQLFTNALRAFDAEAPFVLDGEIFLAPSLVARGLPGKLLEKLLEFGVRPLASEHIAGIDRPRTTVASIAERLGVLPDERPSPVAPMHSPLGWLSVGAIPANDPSIDHHAVSLDLFAASTPNEELREVCRRAVAEGVRWDEVEIVATDVDTYGVALDALCQQLGIGATMLHGVPLARTRIGRALERWLNWLNDGLPADVIRQALEAGELHATNGEISSAALARELRPLKIGWGRARYETAIEALERGRAIARLTAHEDEAPEEFEARRESRRAGCAALAVMLRALLDATPPVPERGSDRHVNASTSTLAHATLEWLTLLPLHGVAEEQTAIRVRTRLQQIAALEEQTTPFANALAALREALSDLRAWPLVSEYRKPWSAAGGMPHLSDLAHAGATGRPRTFVVGLDADRTLSGGRQDPLVPDTIRRALDDAPLATSTERRDEAAYALAAALAMLRGRITLSYATSSSLASREAGAAPILLQACRIRTGDRAVSYEHLRGLLRPPACAVPSRDTAGLLRGGALLDQRDVWLDALADGPLLLDGDALIAQAFPMLAIGLQADALANGDAFSAYHGLVAGAGTVLDLTRANHRAVSPSELERLSKCPLSWFYRYGLSLYTVDDPEYDDTRWLDSRDRGSLLHEVFERFIEEFRARQADIGSAAASSALETIVAAVIEKWRQQVPPPSEATFRAETIELNATGNAFLTMERERASAGDGGRWREVEYSIGAPNRDGAYDLGDGRSLPIKGRVDRVDELKDGTLLVIDYKTGGAKRFTKSPKRGLFNGGRHLQPAIYSAALHALLGNVVSRFEYRFPTPRGENTIIEYRAEELVPARPLIAALLDYVSSGQFVPTTDKADCSNCDHQSICRVHVDDYGNADSPRATWAHEHSTLAVFVSMSARRTKGEGE